ncbi:response regulator [Sphingobium aquiterrae]|uniref:response regulator n=1 Tax=Sphingobium aquiterrae TaxID=2038656 RepID=UPI00301701AF
MFFGRASKAIRRILVVEDEPIVAFDIEHFLTVAGYGVADTVDSYDHARDVILQGGIDLVVADVNLAGQEKGQRDGIAVARLAQEKDIAVLFVTGACPMDAQHLAHGCLSKPYAQRDLLAAIEVIDAVLRGAKLPRMPHGLSLFKRALDDDAAA